MGQQTNQQQSDRDERTGEEMARRPGGSENSGLADSAMGTGNDDPIDNWATSGASGSTDTASGSSVTSGNNDRTDEIGAPTDTDAADPTAETEDARERDEDRRHGVGNRATYMSEEPQNSK